MFPVAESPWPGKPWDPRAGSPCYDKPMKIGIFTALFGDKTLEEALDIIQELLPEIARVGGYFHVGLNELARKYSVVKEVRGFGLMLGMELHASGKQAVLDAIVNIVPKKVLAINQKAFAAGRAQA